MSEKEKKDIPAEEVNTEPAAEEVKEETKLSAKEAEESAPSGSTKEQPHQTSSTQSRQAI